MSAATITKGQLCSWLSHLRDEDPVRIQCGGFHLRLDCIALPRFGEPGIILKLEEGELVNAGKV